MFFFKPDKNRNIIVHLHRKKQEVTSNYFHLTIK